MARDKAYGATNEPRTCLWCGARLTQIMTFNSADLAGVPRTTSACCKRPVYTDEMVEHPILRCERCHETQSQKVYRRTGEPTGRYGESGAGLFCRTRCGYQFGHALAQHGRRLKPLERSASHDAD